jgi:hypothetical protein
VFDGQWLVSGSWDETARVWDAATGKRLLTLGGHGGWVSRLAVADESTVLTASHDGNVRVWDLRSGAPARDLASSIVVTVSDRKLPARDGRAAQPRAVHAARHRRHCVRGCRVRRTRRLRLCLVRRPLLLFFFARRCTDAGRTGAGRCGRLSGIDGP